MFTADRTLPQLVKTRLNSTIVTQYSIVVKALGLTTDLVHCATDYHTRQLFTANSWCSFSHRQNDLLGYNCYDWVILVMNNHAMPTADQQKATCSVFTTEADTTQNWQTLDKS